MVRTADPTRENAVTSFYEALVRQNRRTFLGEAVGGVGGIALGSLLGREARGGSASASVVGGLPGLPHFAPKAKRVLCLFQSGGMSHVDLFDDKPTLHEYNGKDIPPSVKGDQRLTGMTSGQAAYPVLPPLKPGKKCGPSGTWISDLLPHLQGVAEHLCVVKTLHTEAINHDPGITYLNTGNQQPGYASMGAWVTYGLGTVNENLPAFIAMVSQGTGKNPGQPIYSRLWGSGFLPSSHQGVGLRPGRNPVLYLDNPPGVTRPQRRELLDDLAQLNDLRAQELGDPETLTRVKAYEMAFRMQASVPELVDLSSESDSTFDLYGDEARKPGTFAWNCLMARRLCERGVRFVQLFHRGWDQHLELPKNIAIQCAATDRASAGLVKDLKQRGLLDDTLIVWGGEFGRTVYCQGKLMAEDYGRDHHPRCFTVWLAGAGIKAGTTWGETDDFGYNIVRDPVHVHDLNATILHLLGIDHTRLTFKFQGRHYRLTDVHGEVVKGVLA